MHDSALQGRIGYFDADGVQTGTETFARRRIGDDVLLRAWCEMDDIDLTREVSLRMDGAMRPRDAFVRVTRGGVNLLSGWFDVTPEAVSFEARNAALGRVRQRLETAEPCVYLGLHPLVGDALVAPWRGLDQPGVARTLHGITNSLGANGDEGLIATPCAIEVAYLGDEEITVAAGRFAAHRYALRWRPEWPPADVWTAGPEHLFLCMTWSQNGARYELLSLEGGE